MGASWLAGAPRVIPLVMMARRHSSFASLAISVLLLLLLLGPVALDATASGGVADDDDDDDDNDNADGSKYVVVVDLGSSGSRAFVYRFHPPVASEAASGSIGKGDQQTQQPTPPPQRGLVTGSKGLKVRPGISELAEAREFSRAARYLGPLFAHTKSSVPRRLRATTPVFLRATAGMRLLPAELQDELFDRLYADLVVGQKRVAAAGTGSHMV